MKKIKKNIILLSALGLGVLLSSCEYTRDPYKEWKDAAIEAYKTYYAKPENSSKPKDPLFYLDLETLKGAIAYNETDAVYLGQFNFSNFTFSEAPKKYFADVGDLSIRLDDTDSDGVPDSFDFGGYIKKEGEDFSFDTGAFLLNPPLILHEITKDNEIKTYSQVNKDGTVEASGNKDYYNPNFFFISDLSINFSGLDTFTGDMFDFTGKDLAILRTDIYDFIEKGIDIEFVEQINQIINIPELLKNCYKKSIGISLNDDMPSTLTYPAYHTNRYGNDREVLVGPNGLIYKLISLAISSANDDVFVSNINKVESIYLEEGIKTVTFAAFESSLNEEGNSTSSIKNIYLPSTLQEVQFSSFAKLDLENLYIPKTYKTDESGNKVAENAFSTIDLGNVKLEAGGVKLEIFPSFGFTSIQNMYFEDYDNLNLQKFNFSQTKLTSDEDIDKAVKIYHGNYDTTKFDTISEAFSEYESVNPFYQLNLTDELNNKKYRIDCDVSTIPAGKKLYLPYFEYSRSINDSRQLINYEDVNLRSSDVSLTDAKITLKLQSDLVVNGELIIGSQIGITSTGSGINVAEFSAIDLNGHNIIISDGGKVIGDGAIFDSAVTKGKVIVKNTGRLEANLVVKDYTNIDDLLFKAENDIALFENYGFESIKTDIEVENGGQLFGKVDYFADNFANENLIQFVGDESALLHVENGKIIIGTDSIKSSEGSKVTFGSVYLLSIKDESAYDDSLMIRYTTKTNPFSLSNETYNVVFDEFNVNANLAAINGSLNVNKLNLNEGSKIHSKDRNIIIHNSLSITSTGSEQIVMSGDFKTSSSTFTSSYELINSNEAKITTTSNEKTFKFEENKQFAITRKADLKLIDGTNTSNFDHLYHKFDKGYYYLYEDSYAKGSLCGTDGTTLASYDSSIKNTWDAYLSGSTTVETYVSTTNKTISSFTTDGPQSYILVSDANNVRSWNSNINPDPTYPGIFVSDNGDRFIKIGSDTNFTEGKIVENAPKVGTIFEATESGKKYFYYDNGIEQMWHEIVQTYDYSFTLQFNDGTENIYTSIIDGTYRSGITSYNPITHITEYGGNKYAFSDYGTTYKYYKLENDQVVDWNKRQISSGSGNPYIFLDSKYCWAKVDELNNGVCRFGSYYYFLINSKWYKSVEGENALTYNATADASFGVLNERISVGGKLYKFLMKFGNNVNEPMNLMTPSGKVVVKQSDFPDLWDSTGLAGDHFIAYRHIEMNSKKYLFYKSSDSTKIERYQFEFANGFVPSDVDTSDSNILTKFGFIIYKVNFIIDGVKESKVREIYINVDSSSTDNIIYAGTLTDPDKDDYLGLAVFCDTNPISSATGGIPGISG